MRPGLGNPGRSRIIVCLVVYNIMLELQREQPKLWWSECGTVHWGKLNPAKKEVHNGTNKTGSGTRDE